MMCAVKATVWCVFASITLLRSQRCPTFKLKTLLYVILCHENCQKLVIYCKVTWYFVIVMFLSLAQSYSNLCVLKTHCMQAAEQFNKAYTEETLGFVTGGRLIV